MTSSEVLPAVALFAFLAVASVALFSFIAVASWSEARRKERESYYRNDMLKKVAESPGDGAAMAMQLLREEDRLRSRRARQGMKMAGAVLLASGLGVAILLRALQPQHPAYLVGVLIMLIGLAIFGSSYWIVIPEDQHPPA